MTLENKSSMESLLSEPFQKKLITISIVLVVIASIIGFLMDRVGFFGNLLAEVTGIFAGIVIALLLVDRYSALHQEKQWARVRTLTYRAIATHLCDLATEISLYFPLQDNRPLQSISEGRDKPNPEVATSLESLTLQLHQLPEVMRTGRSKADLSVEFYEAISWDLDEIRDVLTPQVVQSSSDQAVINALAEFGHARRKLHNAVNVHRKMAVHNSLPEVEVLLDRTKELYLTLCEHWE